MARKASSWRRWILTWLPATLAGLAGISGCHHSLCQGKRHLQPHPVDYPARLCLDCERVPQHTPESRALATKKSLALAEPQLHPIDLPTALRLADANNPDVALARERINEALARQDGAEALWLPNVELGSTWARHDGQIQRAVGDVFTTGRSSLFVGGGLSLNLGLSEALFAPLAAQQITVARRAGAEGVANQQTLEVALAYVDLLQASAELRINAETTQNSKLLLKLVEDYERAGKGAAADTARARTELERRERQLQDIKARIGAASARLGQLLQLPPNVMLQPAEPAVVPVALVPEDLPLDDLLTQAVANRPELAENRAVIAAALEAWRAAKVAPWVPNLRLSYAAGGFGGGIHEFFGDFNGRQDVALTAVWQLQNFGLGNQAATRDRYSQYAQATFRQASTEALVAAQVVSSFRVAFAKRAELVGSQREVAAALDSYRLNEERIRRAPEQGRPIELLQAIQALAQARQDYLAVVADYNRAQFRLFTAMGSPPLCAPERAAVLPTSEATVPSPVSNPLTLPKLLPPK